MTLLLMECLLAFAPLLDGAALTQGERDRALSHLHATRKMFLDALAGLSQRQWEWKPAPEVWSIAEVAEHVALTEDALYELIVKKLLASPPDPSRKADPEKDQYILKALIDRSRKVQAPEALRPAHRWKTPEELIGHFKQSRDRTIGFVRETQEDLRGRHAPHPLFQDLDAYQWLLLIAGHSERHILQINEVKATPGFPAQ